MKEVKLNETTIESFINIQDALWRLWLRWFSPGHNPGLLLRLVEFQVFAPEFFGSQICFFITIFLNDLITMFFII